MMIWIYRCRVILKKKITEIERFWKYYILWVNRVLEHNLNYVLKHDLIAVIFLKKYWSCDLKYDSKYFILKKNAKVVLWNTISNF